MNHRSAIAVRLEINSVALEDLPIKLLVALKLNRPILNHREDEDRPACASLSPESAEYSFDRARQPDGCRPTKNVPVVPVAVQAAALRFCADCPVRRECGTDADATKEEGLWGGQYRFKESKTRRYMKYDLLDPNIDYSVAAAS